jgi:urate oxidase
MSATLVRNTYGKSRVRLTKVTRQPDRHHLKELCIDVQLEGDFGAAYLHGDNSRVVTTDTMKNIVYVCARLHALGDMESFGEALASHFLRHYPHVTTATIHLVEQPWQRIVVGGAEHPHAFQGGAEKRTSNVTLTRGHGPRIESGIDDLPLLKTAGSSFTGFLRDAFTTLPETTDRIFATALSARWLFGAAPAAYDLCHGQVRGALLETFAGHKSLSVQQTLHTMGVAALAACPAIEQIHLSMPNIHRLLVNLQPFGLENNNEIFVATDEPFGLITGTLRRGAT